MSNTTERITELLDLLVQAKETNLPSYENLARYQLSPAAKELAETLVSIQRAEITTLRVMAETLRKEV